jgi:YLP motif-containing protein 1
MDETYQQSLVKSFKKTIESNLFDFIIVDMVNEKTVHIEDMYSFAKPKGFQVLATFFSNPKLNSVERH